jgi:hypothetical protein
MKSLVLYNHPGRDSNSDADSGGSGGDVEDILKRLGNVETDVSELKSKASAILATIPHLATKADVADVRSAVAELRAEMLSEFGSVRTEMSSEFGSMRAEMSSEFGSVRTEMSSEFGSVRTEMSTGFGALRTEMAARETAFIKWMIATVLTVAGLAFAIAKFVH